MIATPGCASNPSRKPHAPNPELFSCSCSCSVSILISPSASASGSAADWCGGNVRGDNVKETPYLRTVSRESLNVEIQRWRVGITLTTCAVAAAASPFSDSSISPSAYVALPCELLAVSSRLRLFRVLPDFSSRRLIVSALYKDERASGKDRNVYYKEEEEMRTFLSSSFFRKGSSVCALLLRV